MAPAFSKQDLAIGNAVSAYRQSHCSLMSCSVISMGFASKLAKNSYKSRTVCLGGKSLNEELVNKNDPGKEYNTKHTEGLPSRPARPTSW